MAVKSSIQVRLDEDLKKNAESILETIGLDTPTAIRIFFRKIVATRSIPFALDESPYQFSSEEAKQINEAAENSRDAEKCVGPFNDASSMINSLHADAAKT